ncbi:MAG: exosortase/archaeosortase family protein [Candidatus Korobacteraceae bacterium]
MQYRRSVVSGEGEARDNFASRHISLEPLALVTSFGSRLRRHWRVLLIAAAVLLLYLPVLSGLVAQWLEDANYSHGFLVPLFSAYVLWERRRELASVQPRPTPLGLILLLGSLAVLFLGSIGAELFLSRVSLLGVIAGLLLFLHGAPLVRKMAFPLLLLLLMIPIPGVIYYQIVFPLQLLASKLAANVLEFSRVMPIMREGNVLILPTARLEVAEACSGIRSLMSLLTVGVIYGYLAEPRRWIRVLLCVLIVPIAVVSNAGRVIFSALGVEFVGTSVLEGASHLIAGLVVFMIAIAMLVGCHSMCCRAMRFIRPERQAQ